MSQENVEIVRQIYGGLVSRPKAVQELFDPDWELDITQTSPDTGVLRGYEASLEVLRAYWETFENFHYELDEVIHADEKQVVTAVSEGGRMKGSNSEVWDHLFIVWTLRDGKVVRTSAHVDKNRALEAAGLRE